MNDMVTRVAAAILAEAQNMGALAFTLPIERRLAIAAINAMRDPSEGMSRVLGNAAVYGTRSNGEVGPRELMSELVDAALREPNEQEKRSGE